MIKRQWLLWGALIAAVSFASYTYGALQQSRHALAATAGTLLAKTSAASNSNHTASDSAFMNSTIPAQSSVQFQVGQTESLSQWEGLPTPSSSAASATTNSAGGSTNQSNPASGLSEQELSGGAWPAALANLLQSIGVPLPNLTAKGAGPNGLGPMDLTQIGSDDHGLSGDQQALLARLNQMHLPQLQPFLAINQGPHAIDKHGKSKAPHNH